jgi:acetyltransferase-like isoleucine patch superfamily enzyme
MGEEQMEQLESGQGWNADSVSVEEYVIIRPNVGIGIGTTIKCAAIIGTGVRIGSNCYIGPQAMLLHMMPSGESAPAQIHDNVFIGAGAVVMPGVEVCSGTIIGARSLVNKSITVPGTYMGGPCRKISSEVYTP